MNQVPYIPSSAPFTPEQRAWLNGYLTGLFADANAGERNAPAQLAGLPAEKPGPLLVMYGSQTGTAEQLARRFAADAEKRGFAPRVLELNSFGSVDIAQENRLIIVTSTWGDGDPPDNAAGFWQLLNSNAAPPLDHLSYSVLALGDRTYSDFCGAGKKFDERLEQLGAKRIHPRAECDVDYETTAKAWMEAVCAELAKAGQASRIPENRNCNPPIQLTTGPEAASSTQAAGGTPALPYSRSRPFPARVITNRKLNAPGSAKDTRHIEISLKGSGLTYEVGDALGVLPTNCPALVNDILHALGCDGEEGVPDAPETEISLRQALLTRRQVTQPSMDFLEALAERSGDAELKSLLLPARKTDLDTFLHGREVVDLVSSFPAVRFEPVEFVRLLRKLQPRLYSISSSPTAHPCEVHLTVAIVRYESHGRQRKGVCSTFLADRVEPNLTPLPVFVQTAHGFRLPAEGDRPIIMIVPGTGIAPFRAFLEERRARGAKGRNWLFFGDQCRAHDFLYRDELEAMHAEGSLTRLDTAFSRDQAEKIYVQHRMLEHARELWEWLEEGAHVYVCGDARRMAKDVDAALHEIIQRASGNDGAHADEYVRQLKTERRYQRDVY